MAAELHCPTQASKMASFSASPPWALPWNLRCPGEKTPFRFDGLSVPVQTGPVAKRSHKQPLWLFVLLLHAQTSWETSHLLPLLFTPSVHTIMCWLTNLLTTLSTSRLKHLFPVRGSQKEGWRERRRYIESRWKRETAVEWEKEREQKREKTKNAKWQLSRQRSVTYAKKWILSPTSGQRGNRKKHACNLGGRWRETLERRLTWFPQTDSAYLRYFTVVISFSRSPLGEAAGEVTVEKCLNPMWKGP